MQPCASTYTRHRQIPSFKPKPTLADFCVPSDEQKDREIAFIILGMAATGLVAKLAK